MLPYTALAVDYFSYSAVSVIVDADLTLKLLTNTVFHKRYPETCGQQEAERLSLPVAEVTGKAGDAGIDIIGIIAQNVGETRKDYPFVAQCKSSKQKVSVQLLREFEGVLGRENPGTIGMYFSYTGFSVNSMEHCITSVYPIALWTISSDHVKVWQNPKLARLHLSIRTLASSQLELNPTSRSTAVTGDLLRVVENTFPETSCDEPIR
eukprot:gene9744-1947_t